MKKKVECPKCGGYGFIAKWNDCSAWNEYCFECNGTGEPKVFDSNFVCHFDFEHNTCNDCRRKFWMQEVE